MCSFYKYMGQKDSALMLVAKRLAGVAPEFYLGNILRADDEPHKWGIHPGFQKQGKRHQKSKTGYQWPHQNFLRSSK